MAVWNVSEQSLLPCPEPAPVPTEQDHPAQTLNCSSAPTDIEVAGPRWYHGWPIPSSISKNPDEARACIQLPEFDALLLEKARVIAGRFPVAEAEYRMLRTRQPEAWEAEVPHFERVFRLAAANASVKEVEQSADYDALVILTAWYCVRPGVEGFLGSYPKSLLCPLSHSAPPAALET